MPRSKPKEEAPPVSRRRSMRITTATPDPTPPRTSRLKSEAPEKAKKASKNIEKVEEKPSRRRTRSVIKPAVAIREEEEHQEEENPVVPRKVPKLVYRRSAINRIEAAKECGQEAPKTPIARLRIRRSALVTPAVKKLVVESSDDDSSSDQDSEDDFQDAEASGLTEKASEEEENGEDMDEDSADDEPEPATSAVFKLDPAVKSLKGREGEFDQVCTGVAKAMKKHRPVTFYLSGLPGTGKTATMKLVLKALAPCTHSVLINCASVSSMKDVVTRVCNVDGKTPMRGRALNIQTYADKLRRPLLVILDEIDHLKKQADLYSVFRWPQEVSWKLIVIGIANSIDLTERLLPKLKLTIEPVKIPFKPYDAKQMKEIIADKMRAGEAAVDGGHDENRKEEEKAIEFCARKVAGVRGDVRLAWHVMKQVKAGNTPVTPREVLRVVNDTYSSPMAKTKLTLQSRLLLAVCLRMSTNKKTALTRFALFNAYHKACAACKLSALGDDELETVLDNIAVHSFVRVEGNGTIRLQVDANTARQAISNLEMLDQIHRLDL